MDKFSQVFCLHELRVSCEFGLEEEEKLGKWITSKDLASFTKRWVTLMEATLSRQKPRWERREETDQTRLMIIHNTDIMHFQ